MPMLSNPETKYLPYPAVPFPPGYVRQWPNRRATVPPTWLSTDLRDGNQALVNPMSNTTKLELFKLLVEIGFKEIEVAYPSASNQEFQFVRTLIEENHIPDDVSIQIITPARPDLITKSIESLAGAKKAIIHLYNAVSPVFREVVFRNTQEKTLDLVLNAVKLIKKLTEEETARSGTQFTLNYCMETFSQTEPEFTIELGNKVLEVWGKATPENKVMFNLAATVECAPSNHYADMVEYFSININQRDSVTISIHPHNDRGTAVAAAELGCLAGGDRIEGCLLGNGERTGNVDLITLALNLYSQGVSPKLDFSNLSEIVSVVCRCNEMEVPVRYPYAGTLVFSAFAGTHQDAIRKGLDAQEKRWKQVDKTGEGTKHWAMPYVPVDPRDLGFGYENLIRVSSQSGKAGAAHIIKMNLMLDLPRRMQVCFYGVVQAECERTGKEMTKDVIVDSFRQTYSLSSKPIRRLFLSSYTLFSLSPNTNEPASSPMSDYSDDETTYFPSEDEQKRLRIEAQIVVDGRPRTISGEGSSPVKALMNALRNDLDLDVAVGETVIHDVVAPNGQLKSASYVEVHWPSDTPAKSGAGSIWGVGLSDDLSVAKCRALISAVSGIVGQKELPKPKRTRPFSPRSSSMERGSDTWLKDVKLRAGHNPLHGDVEPMPLSRRSSYAKLEAST